MRSYFETDHIRKVSANYWKPSYQYLELLLLLPRNLPFTLEFRLLYVFRNAKVCSKRYRYMVYEIVVYLFLTFPASP